jgi:alpha-tubulin suppressor-like RCC1 family protein
MYLDDREPRMTGKRGLLILAAVLGVAVGPAPSAEASAPGIVVAWGHNGFGELGNATTTNGLTATQAEGIGGVGQLTGVVAVADGGYHSLALRSDGSVVAWGYNAAGALGDGTLTNRATPAPVKDVGGLGTLTGVVAIAGGGYHSLALRSDGSVVAWGSNSDGQLGDGTVTNRTTPVPVKDVGGAGTLTGVVAIAAGYDKSIALRADGTVVAWGNNPGDGTPNRLTPVEVSGVGGVDNLTGVVAVAAGGYHSLALRFDGSVVAWGDNPLGELGNGTTTKSLTPVQVAGPVGTGTLSGITSIAAGFEHSLALRSDGRVFAWGNNGEGELGDGTTTNRSTPVPVLGISGSGPLTGVVAIVGGTFHNLALRAGGTVAAWGHNSYGELGNGTTSSSATPVPVLGIGGATALAAVVALAPGSYSEHSLAIQGASTSLSPTRIAFGNQLTGTASAAHTVTLTNSGPALLTISGESLTGAGAPSFQRTTDSCAGATLAAGDACQVALRFAPGAAGVLSATLAFQTSAANALAAVALTGAGVAPSSPPPHGPVLRPPGRPVLSVLTLSPPRFRAAPAGPTALPTAARKYGTLLSYHDTQAAVTTISVQRPTAGTLKHRRCVTLPKRAKPRPRHCTPYLTITSFTHDDHAGLNRLRFTGRVARHKLPPGRYRLLAIARNGARTSAPRQVRFQIKRADLVSRAQAR